MCWREGREIWTPVHCWWENKMAQLLWKTIWHVLKLKIELPYDTTIPHVGICPKLFESRDMNRYLYTHAHSRVYKSWLWLLIRAGFTITKRWKHQTWLNKQNVVCTHNGILLSLKKIRNSDIILQHDEPWRYYAKWNKPDTKSQMLYNSSYMRYIEWLNS